MTSVRKLSQCHDCPQSETGDLLAERFSWGIGLEEWYRPLRYQQMVKCSADLTSSSR